MGYNVTMPARTVLRSTKIGPLVSNKMIPIGAKPPTKSSVRGYYGNNYTYGRGTSTLFASNPKRRR